MQDGRVGAWRRWRAEGPSDLSARCGRFRSSAGRSTTVGRRSATMRRSLRTQIENKIDAFAARIADAQARDNVRWNTLGKRTWVECWNKATYQEEVDALKQWIRARITWMDQQISEYRFLNP